MSIVTCQQCGAKNRVDEAKAQAMNPTCGRCGAQLVFNSADGSKPIEVTDENFAREVLGADRPVLLDCWAPWCGPCRMIAPVMDQLAAEANGRYIVAKLNVDESPQTAARLGIQSIPTLLIFKNGRVVDLLIGAQPKQVISSHLRAHL
ncbi:MAG: thiol reductase thioredoxin [Pyrinomonas sp.]|uniref:thioredoxin TrxC n=1 Tax=Pyrinomonas sp. TaxID=2080306 RepID=UPI003321D599